MSLNLDEVIPLGRCLGEYREMFSLTPSDLKLAILDCAGGTASFNAEMTRLGNKVISCDRIYRLTAGQIRAHLAAQANLCSYRWDYYFQSPQHIAQVRRDATKEFLEDFASDLQQDRYVTAELPVLPFENDQFDLALCSHFLFTDPKLSKKFLRSAITEMCRVAKEVRVFPLLGGSSGVESHHLNPIVTELSRSFHVEPRTEVNYEFQKGGNKMLRVSKKSSA